MPNKRQAIDFFPKKPKKAVSDAPKKSVPSSTKKAVRVIPSNSPTARSTSQLPKIPAQPSTSKKSQKPAETPQNPPIQPKKQSPSPQSEPKNESPKIQKEKKRVFSASRFSKSKQSETTTSPFIKNPNIEKRPLSNSLPAKKETYERPEEKVIARPEEIKKYGRKKESKGLPFPVILLITVILGVATGVGVYFLVAR